MANKDYYVHLTTCTGPVEEPKNYQQYVANQRVINQPREEPRSYVQRMEQQFQPREYQPTSQPTNSSKNIVTSTRQIPVQPISSSTTSQTRPQVPTQVPIQPGVTRLGVQPQIVKNPVVSQPTGGVIKSGGYREYSGVQQPVKKE